MKSLVPRLKIISSLLPLIFSSLFVLAEDKAPDPLMMEIPIPEACQTLPTAVVEIVEANKLHAGFLEAWETQVIAPIRPQLTKMRKGYAQALLKEAEKVRKNGDLKLSNDMKAEAKAVSSGAPVPWNRADSGGDVEETRLTEFRDLYHKSKDKIAQATKASRKRLNEDFKKQLIAHKDEFAKAERTDDARVLESWLSLIDGEKPQIDLSKARPKQIALPPLTSVKDSRPAIRNFTDIVNQFPLRLDLMKDRQLNEDQLEAVNIELRKENNRLVRWMVTLDKKEASPFYGSTHRLVTMPDKITFGNNEFITKVCIYFRGEETFDTKVRGNLFEIAGRFAWTRLTDKEGGTWELHIANGSLFSDTKKDNRGLPLVAGIPQLKILGASFGSGGRRKDVKDIVTDVLIHRHQTVWASRGLFGDPAPYWQKNLHISYEYAGAKKSISRHEGSGATLVDFYQY